VRRDFSASSGLPRIIESSAWRRWGEGGGCAGFGGVEEAAGDFPVLGLGGEAGVGGDVGEDESAGIDEGLPGFHGVGGLALGGLEGGEGAEGGGVGGIEAKGSVEGHAGFGGAALAEVGFGLGGELAALAGGPFFVEPGAAGSEGEEGEEDGEGDPEIAAEEAAPELGRDAEAVERGEEFSQRVAAGEGHGLGVRR
jgi:hypothetical protein